MKSSFDKKKLNKKIKSVDVNRALKIKKLLKKKTDVHKSEINNNRTSLKDLRRYNDKDEISILSNANLNIIKNLINCANEDFLNDSSFGIINNNNDEQKEKEKSVLSISRWKNNICGYKGSPTHNNTKKKEKDKKVDEMIENIRQQRREEINEGFINFAEDEDVSYIEEAEKEVEVEVGIIVIEMDIEGREVEIMKEIDIEKGIKFSFYFFNFIWYIIY